jgi:hypothetical protein
MWIQGNGVPIRRRTTRDTERSTLKYAAVKSSVNSLDNETGDLANLHTSVVRRRR